MNKLFYKMLNKLIMITKWKTKILDNIVKNL